jgi:hypothetical protein
MIPPFSWLVDYAVGAHFRTDSRGRVVFLSLISKGQGHFVDSKADEEKLRALVGMYRGSKLNSYSAVLLGDNGSHFDRL